MDQVTQSALSGAAQGASMGMTFGPWGAAIGAVGGGIYGYTQGEKEVEAQRIAKVQDDKNNSTNRILAQQAASQSQDVSYNNPNFSSISGANTLPMSDSTQMRPGVEPHQQTQMNEQTQALGFG
jgi:hypothetical protein